MLSVCVAHHPSTTSRAATIAEHRAMHPWFNQMLGFSEDDVRQMIRYYKEAGATAEVTEEGIIDDIKPWYDCPLLPFAEIASARTPACSTATWCATIC